ncbi:MAG: DNA mismatch repair endonuclease MutL [Firmicutes bacterium]|nr:DNA mismatch repair endonuclease MutL [Bacillota bacterium]
MIRVLDKAVADKIAAGEVIDRPVSIVKELVENSLDAGASSITVELRKGGKEYIRITDDGCGIDAEETELAFRRHATSKITSEEDLDSIRSLGFRGEALASICAVARVDMITKTGEAHAGRHVVCEGSEILRSAPTGCPEGTTITVRDLFYNVPARKKFLGTDGAESRRIIDLMSRIALAYPDVRFRLINGRQEVFSTTGRGSILDNICRIYGRDIGRDLVPVDVFREPYLLRGFVSSPGVSTSSRNRQFFCVNGRVVSSKTVEQGLEKAYRERLFPGRFPIAFLFLQIPADQLDVNVHPTKKEIRFDDPFAVEDFICESVASALEKSQAIPAAEADRAKPAQEPPKPAAFQEPAEKEPAAEAAKAGDPVDPAPLAPEASSGTQVDIKKLLQTMRQDAVLREPDAADAPMISDPVRKEMEQREERLDIASLEVIGSVFNTYIITTDGECVYLIDQHAAHERVFYERLLAQYHSSEKLQQEMLIPLQISVSAEVESAEESWIGYLRAMGYDIENFGGRVYLVRAVPAFGDPKESEAFLRQMLLELEQTPDVHSFAGLDRLIMRSCKSAVKGGDVLHPAEIRALLSQLAACDRPWSCPHGRPTIVRLSRYDLERMFKR